MKIGIASDHWGYDKKDKLKTYLSRKGIDVKDYGTNSTEITDFPQYAFALGEAVVKKDVDYGIVICSTGIGISIAANKVKGLRCYKLNTALEAKLSKNHNDANMIAFGRKTMMFLIKDMVDIFLKTEVSAKKRYENRNLQIKEYESKK